MTKFDRERFGPWALVTGASSGIGAEFARQLAAKGLNLVLVARRHAALEDLGTELKAAYGIQTRAVKTDLSGSDYLERIEEATAGLDIGTVISNAGAALPGAFLSSDLKAMCGGIDLNVTAHLGLAHHFGRRLVKRGQDGILLMSASAGLQGVPYLANGAAAKAYVLALGEGLNAEFKDAGLNMTVLIPGPTDTALGSRLKFDTEAMPLRLLEPRQVAAEGLAALARNRATHVVGRASRLMAAVVPRRLRTKVMGGIMAKSFKPAPNMGGQGNQSAAAPGSG